MRSTSPKFSTQRDPLDLLEGKSETLSLQTRAHTKDSPLHGIPVLVKNNIATKDKMDTTGLSPLTIFEM